MSATLEPQSKPGPKTRGPRKQFPVRMPSEQFLLYKRRAEAEGVSVSDYIVATLARAHDLPEPEYVTQAREQARREAEQYREMKEGHLPIAM